MKRYVVFFGAVLGTGGGACDFIRDFASLKQAMSYRETLLSMDRPKTYWCHVWDTKEIRIIPDREDEHGQVMGDNLD